MPFEGTNYQFDKLYESNLGGIAQSFDHINLYQIGELSCLNGYTVPPHRQWCHEISCVIRGEGVFTTDDQANLLTEGGIHFAPAGSMHSIRASDNVGLRYGYIGFTFDETIDDADIAKLKQYYEGLNRYTAVDKHDVTATLFRGLTELYGNSDYTALMTKSFVIQLLVLIYRSFEEQPCTEYFPQLKDGGSKRLVHLVTQYVGTHIFDNITVSEMAAAVGYNYSYLSHIFNQATGMTVSQYISKIKIQKAIELMHNGQFSISAVAERLNFATVQSFNRAFKRNMGCSPATFMKNVKSGIYAEQQQESEEEGT